MSNSNNAHKQNKYIKKAHTLWNHYRKHGFVQTLRLIKSKVLCKSLGKKYIKKNIPSAEQMRKERKTQFEYSPLISILVPLYNTPEKFLKEMIDSVINQTYSNWELCLADGSDEEHSYVGKMCAEYAQVANIKYTKLDKNYGISGNTNKCLELATGEYIALFDHDDVLHQSALFDVVTSINEQNADFIYTDESSFETDVKQPVSIHMKPDFAPDTLRSYNYICHLSVFSRELMNQVGNYSNEHNGSQDYDMVLRLTEKAKHVVHIARVLYYWRIHENSVASDISAKPYCVTSAKKAIKDQLDRLGLDGEVTDSKVITTYKINYKILGNPLISILIPNKDHIGDLKKCVYFILNKSTYKNFEIIIIENNSEDQETFKYYKKLERNPKIRVVYYNGDFNYSAINNFGAKYAKGEHLLLLNNDVRVITSQWLEEMLMFSQRKDVGAVGAKLYFPDDSIQHAGVILGINHVAGHAHKGWSRDDDGYAARLTIAQDMSAVTGACLMTRKDVFDEINGLDEKFCVSFNDVDMCLRIRKLGYLIVFTPYAELYHYESKSRGYDEENKSKRERYDREEKLLRDRWEYELNNDPYYNKNLTLEREDFSFK